MTDKTNTADSPAHPEIPLFLAEARAYYESALQELWAEIPLGIELPLRSGGNRFRVLSRGVHNHGPGPDFLNAKLEIDGAVKHGDVEIHCRLSGWAAHGHDGDPAYDQVILHAVDIVDTPGENAAAATPLLPLYVIPKSFDTKKLKNIPPAVKQGACGAFFSRLPDEALHRFAGDAGLDRFREKSQALMKQMIRLGARAAFLMKLFDLVGIPGNRKHFAALAERVLAYPAELRERFILPILWGESGCLPDPAKVDLEPEAEALVCSLWNEWWPIRRQAAAPLAFSRRGRPVNSIERKIALLAAFIRAFGENPLPALLAATNGGNVDDIAKNLLERLQLSDAFWSCHTSFLSPPSARPAALIGRDRVLELTADLFLPALCAYATINGDLKHIARLESIFLVLPKTAPNRILRIMMDACFSGRGNVFRTAAAQQGVIHLYRTYCERLAFDCKACPVADLV